jgi:Pilus formation protein N terminal region
MPFSNIRRLFVMERIVISALFSILSLTAFTSSTSAETIKVLVDEAKLVELNRPVHEVIIGNPSIADVAVLSKNVLVFTGKSAGHTNVILLDENNRQILNRKVHVSTSNESGMVVLQLGSSRRSYHCGTICNSRLAFGDDPAYTTGVKQNQEDKLKYLSTASKAGR